MAFYRLTAAWLLRVASPSYAAGLAPDIPLPPAAPEGFRMLPVGNNTLPQCLSERRQQ